MQFSGFIEALSRVESTEEAFDLLCQAVSSLGWTRIAFLALTPEARQQMAGEADSSPLLASNYPDEYVSRYLNERYFEIDPVLQLARDSLTPIAFKDIEDSAQLSERQKEFMAARRNAGLYRELCCPVHGAGGQVFAVCFARDGPEEWDRAYFSALQVLAMHFYYAFYRRIQASSKPAARTGLAESTAVATIETPSLTQRERECLLWTARGKSASTISVILGLSENTINFYVKNAMKKLGTTNRVIAVVLAVRSGLIQP